MNIDNLKKFMYIGIVAGVMMLGWGIINLQQIFLSEHERSLLTLENRRKTLQTYAQQHVRQQLFDKINEAIDSLATAVENPLSIDDSILWINNDEQRLPLLWHFRKKDKINVGQFYDAVLSGNTIHDAYSDDVNQFISIAKMLKEAIVKDDASAISHSLKDLLRFRLQNQLLSSIELTATLAILDIFDDYEKASERLIHQIILSGIDDGKGNYLESLQANLIRRRNKLSKQSFDFLKQRTIEMSKRHNIPHDQFLALSNPSEVLDTLPIVKEDKPVLWNEQWYLERSEQDIVGVKVNLLALEANTYRHMLELRLVNDDENIELIAPKSASIEIENLQFIWHSDQWVNSKNELEYYHTTKKVLLLGCCLIFISLIFVVWSIHRRQQRWLGLRSEFISTVSHELRTPLSSIRLMAERLAHRLAGNERARDYPQRIINDIDSLSFLVENILSYNRLQSDKWRAEKSHVVLAELINNVIEEINLYTTKPVDINITGDQSVTAYADPLLIKILLINLIKNASLYNHNDNVTINIVIHENTVVSMTFSDNGVGIETAEKRDVFEAFYRGKEHRHMRGSGLGLALCHKIMKLHNGTIYIVKSDSSGTTFSIELPKLL